MGLPIPEHDPAEREVPDFEPGNRRAYHRDVVDLRRQMDVVLERLGAVNERVKSLEAERPSWDYQSFARDCIVAHLASFGGKQIKYFHQWIPLAWTEFQKALREGPDGTEPMSVSEIVGIQAS